MKTFQRLKLDTGILKQNLDELAALLAGGVQLEERDLLLPFFKDRPHLCAGLGIRNGDVYLPDSWACELDLFGDFVCDIGAGDSESNAYTLVELEAAKTYSIFKRRVPGKSVRRWASPFERGISQLVDWAWRLSEEAGTSSSLQRIFGDSHPSIHFMLVIGRNGDLDKDDLARLRWRSDNVSFGNYKMTCCTFDDLLYAIRRRLSFEAQPSLGG